MQNKVWWGIALGIFLWLLPGAYAKEYPFGPVTLSVEEVTTGNTSHGYVEYRVKIVHRGLTLVPHKVTLAMPNRLGGGNGHRLRTVSRTTNVGPGAEIYLSLWQGPLELAGSDGFVVYVDGVRFQEQLSVHFRNHGQHSSWSGDNASWVLYSKGVGDSFVDGLNPNDYNRQLRSCRAATPVERWSDKWLSYSCYDTVVLTAKEMGQLNSGTRAALLHYAKAGGNVTVVGPYTPPKPWKQKKGTIRVHENYNYDYDYYNPSYETKYISHESLGWSIYELGFGRVVSSSQGMNFWQQYDWDLLRTITTESYSPWRDRDNVGEANSKFPVIEDFGVPVRGLFIVVLIFALTIGPFNLWLLAKKNRKIWVLWTAPTISLVTCIAVFAYAIFAEGLSGHLRMKTLTVLDEVSQEATSIGMIAYYTPLTPSDGLRFSFETEVTPQVRNHWRNSGRWRTVNWTNEQHLDSGWVSARVPAHFQIRKSEKRLERLPLTQKDGKTQVTNGFGVTITNLTLRDHEGNYFWAKSAIPPGQKVILEKGRGFNPSENDQTKKKKAKEKQGALKQLREIYKGNWANTHFRASEYQHMELLNGSYLAETESSVFVEKGMEGADEKPETSLVFGVMKGAKNAD